MSSLRATVSLLSQLSDATRLRILQLLDRQELSVAQLVQITQLSQPRISTHLRKLKDAQMVVSRKQGAFALYRLHEQMPPAASSLWQQLRDQVQDQVFEHDAARLDAMLACNRGESWPEQVAGSMEQHYSPGRTWQATSLGLAALLDLGEVLDIGSGDGALAAMAAHNARRWVCLDHSPTLLAAARLRLAKRDNVEFSQSDMHKLPFADHSFDQVLHFHALTYAQDPHKALASAARVLRPGGTLLLLTLAPHDAMELASGFGHQKPGFCPQELAQMAQESGLEVRACERVARESQPPFFELVRLCARAIA